MTAAPFFSERILAFLRVPGGDEAGDLRLDGDALVCSRTGRRFPFIEGAGEGHEGRACVLRRHREAGVPG